MRVAVVTESFLPQVNGVSHTVQRTVEHLTALGHQALVVAPGDGPDHHRTGHGTVPVVRVRSVALPGYRSFPVGVPDRAVERALADFDADLVHLASPISLGAVGLRAARRLGLPTVAVYQTDVSGFARQYGVRATPVLDRWVARLHRRADRTLVPSSASHQQLARYGVPHLHRWGRGVALEQLGPQHRDDELREEWGVDEDRRVVVGYVGRLAAEKQVHRLTALADLPGVRLVVVGDGPRRAALERRLPQAIFTGMLRGTELAAAFASLDVFVHTGDAETFCQTVQEAQASAVAAVAPASGGPLDLIDHGTTGLLFDPTDPGAMRASVSRLVEDPGLRADLAAAGRRRVATRTWRAVVSELVDVHYAAVLTGAEQRGLAA